MCFKIKSYFCSPHLVVVMSNKNSGAQNRKRIAKQEKDAAIQKDSLLQFKQKNEGED